jgi:hypothetical protein
MAGPEGIGGRLPQELTSRNRPNDNSLDPNRDIGAGGASPGDRLRPEDAIPFGDIRRPIDARGWTRRPMEAFAAIRPILSAAQGESLDIAIQHNPNDKDRKAIEIFQAISHEGMAPERITAERINIIHEGADGLDVWRITGDSQHQGQPGHTLTEDAILRLKQGVPISSLSESDYADYNPSAIAQGNMNSNPRPAQASTTTEGAGGEPLVVEQVVGDEPVKADNLTAAAGTGSGVPTPSRTPSVPAKLGEENSQRDAGGNAEPGLPLGEAMRPLDTGEWQSTEDCISAMEEQVSLAGRRERDIVIRHSSNSVSSIEPYLRAELDKAGLDPEGVRLIADENGVIVLRIPGDPTIAEADRPGHILTPEGIQRLVSGQSIEASHYADYAMPPEPVGSTEPAATLSPERQQQVIKLLLDSIGFKGEQLTTQQVYEGLEEQRRAALGDDRSAEGVASLYSGNMLAGEIPISGEFLYAVGSDISRAIIDQIEQGDPDQPELNGAQKAQEARRSLEAYRRSRTSDQPGDGAVNTDDSDGDPEPDSSDNAPSARPAAASAPTPPSPPTPDISHQATDHHATQAGHSGGHGHDKPTPRHLTNPDWFVKSKVGRFVHRMLLDTPKMAEHEASTDENEERNRKSVLRVNAERAIVECLRRRNPGEVVVWLYENKVSPSDFVSDVAPIIRDKDISFEVEVVDRLKKELDAGLLVDDDTKAWLDLYRKSYKVQDLFKPMSLSRLKRFIKREKDS